MPLKRVKIPATPTGTSEVTAGRTHRQRPGPVGLKDGGSPRGQSAGESVRSFATPSIVTGNAVPSGLRTLNVTLAVFGEMLKTRNVVLMFSPDTGSTPLATWGRLKEVAVAVFETTGSEV